MPNTNILVNPDVQGNISSCKTEVTVINGSSRGSLWFVNDTGYATNNCTGQVDRFESWSLSGFSIGLMILVGVVVFIVSLRAIFD